MPAKLHELLAVIGDRATTSGQMLKEAETSFTKRADHYRGQTRSVSFFAESRASENTTDTKEVVDSVDSKLAYVYRHVGAYWDALLQLETTNATARADLVVDGEVLAKDVPATWLLGMETRLKDLRAMLLTTPTLPPELTWHDDAGAGDHTYVSAPQVSFKTEKQVNHKVLYEATKEHPAQIEKWNEDVPVARIETIHRSTMLTPARKARIIGRVDDLIRCVKRARQRANSVEVIGDKIADKMFGYIMEAK